MALGLAGCATGATGEAGKFVEEHGRGASDVASATHALEQAAAGLPASLNPARLGQLTSAAVRTRRAAEEASEWDASGESAEAALEEEDLPRAEAQVTSAAGELVRAVVAIQAYTRARSAGRLTRYRNKLGAAREQWDDGIAEIWRLAKRSDPPTL